MKQAKYGNSPLIRMCAPTHSLTLARCLLGAFIYAEEIAAIIGEEYQPTDSILTMLQRHFVTRNTVPEYANLMRAVIEGRTDAWDELDIFIRTACAQVPDETEASRDALPAQTRAESH